MKHWKISRQRSSWLDIVLLGEKLRGGFTLVQIERRSKSSSRRDYWLLIKSRDEYADPSWDIESLRYDRSVLTGRSLKEIKDEKPIKPRFGRRRV
jgi:bifunctional non-homologous end joining protein LigD